MAHQRVGIPGDECDRIDEALDGGVVVVVVVGIVVEVKKLAILVVVIFIRVT